MIKKFVAISFVAMLGSAANAVTVDCSTNANIDPSGDAIACEIGSATDYGNTFRDASVVNDDAIFGITDWVNLFNSNQVSSSTYGRIRVREPYPSSYTTLMLAWAPDNRTQSDENYVGYLLDRTLLGDTLYDDPWLDRSAADYAIFGTFSSPDFGGGDEVIDPVPLPAGMVLMLSAFGALGLSRRRRL